MTFGRLIVAQELFQLLSGAHEPHIDGGRGEADQLADLAAAQIFIVPQHDGRAGKIVELLKRGGDAIALLALMHSRKRIGVDHNRLIRQRFGRLTAKLSAGIQRDVSGDAKEPVAKALGLLERLELAPGPQECFLGGVGRAIGITGGGIGDGQH